MRYLLIALMVLIQTDVFCADFSAMKLKNVAGTIINPATSDKQGNLSPSGNQVISTYMDRFRDDFATYDTTNNWTTVQTGSGQSIAIGGAANGSSYLRISSGTTSGAETIILSKVTFTMPFKVSFGLSLTDTGAATDGRVANLLPIFEIVEVDGNGDVVATASAQTYTGTCPNAMQFAFDGTTATTHRYTIRSSGITEVTATGTSWGTTIPTGTYPNMIQAYNYYMTSMNEIGIWNSEAVNSATASTARKNTARMLDSTKTYAVRIRLKNTGTVATSTDMNIHFVRVSDASRVSVDFGMISGSVKDNNLAIPVYATNMVAVVYTRPSTSYGSSSHYPFLSAATTNETSMKNAVTVVNSLLAWNKSDNDAYLKLYNKATAPVLASDTPAMVLFLPAGMPPTNVIGTHSIRFATGVGFAITGAPGYTDTTAVGAEDVGLYFNYD